MFQASLRNVKIAIITARIILHLISYPQFTYDLFHMHHSLTYLSREHMSPKWTCSQRQWLHSSVGRASHRYREVTGSSPVVSVYTLKYEKFKIRLTGLIFEMHTQVLFATAIKIHLLIILLELTCSRTEI